MFSTIPPSQIYCFFYLSIDFHYREIHRDIKYKIRKRKEKEKEKKRKREIQRAKRAKLINSTLLIANG
jgi:hypothetical protein